MSLLDKRPLATASLCFILFSVLLALFPPIYALLLLPFLGGLAVLFFVKGKKAPFKRSIVAILILGLALGMYCLSYVLPQKKVASLGDASHTFVGKVVDTTVFEDGQELILRLHTVDGERVRYKVSLYADKDWLTLGDVISFEGGIYPLLEETDAVYDKAKGIIGKIDGPSSMKLLEHRFSLRGELSAINGALAKRISSATKGKDLGLYAALLLGNKDGVSIYTSGMFRRAGISHLLAISGLHLTVLLAFFRRLLSRAKLPLRVLDGLCIGFILFYSALSGGAPSILRAAFMGGFGLLAPFFGRRNDGFTSLFFTGALLILFSQGTVYDLGFWLSFFATYGILLSTKLPILSKPQSGDLDGRNKQSKWKALGYTFLDTLKVTLFATLFTLPLCCLFFGEASLLGIPATLLLSPIVSGMLMLGMPLILVSFVPYLGSAFGWAVSFLPRILVKITTFFGELPIATVSVNYGAVSLFAVLLLTALFVFPLLKAKASKRLGIVAAGLFVILVTGVALGNLMSQKKEYMAYEEMGYNDFFLVSDGGEKVLFDLSSGGSRGASGAIAFAKAHHCTAIDSLVLTHLHSGHLEYLLRFSSYVDAQTLYLPFPKTAEENETYEALLLLAEEMAMDTVSYSEGDALSFKKTVYTLWESTTLEKDSHNTFALSFERGENYWILLSADYTFVSPSEAQMDRLLLADTLILSAHGGIPKKVGYLPLTDATENVILPNRNLHFLLSSGGDYADKVNWISEKEYRMSFK